jgi:hypothetical protein
MQIQYKLKTLTHNLEEMFNELLKDKQRHKHFKYNFYVDNKRSHLYYFFICYQETLRRPLIDLFKLLTDNYYVHYAKWFTYFDYLVVFIDNNYVLLYKDMFGHTLGFYNFKKLKDVDNFVNFLVTLFRSCSGYIVIDSKYYRDSRFILQNDLIDSEEFLNYYLITNRF